jgi:catechol 2,3-dioxygenase-like lactoylglutathione lyase family enzyme
MTPVLNTAHVRQLSPLLAVQDINQSLEFYRDQLGFTLVGQADSDGKMFWCHLERDGASLMLQQAEDEEDGPAEGRGRGVAFYFICDDANAMHAELLSRGMKLDSPRVAYYGMNQLFVPEPNGYALCFESPVSGSSK